MSRYTTKPTCVVGSTTLNVHAHVPTSLDAALYHRLETSEKGVFDQSVRTSGCTAVHQSHSKLGPRWRAVAVALHDRRMIYNVWWSLLLFNTKAHTPDH
eukprot:6263654-Amphidinium_carterae.1